MTLPLAFLLLLSGGQAAPQPPAAAARSVLAAVLTQELEEVGARARNICIRPALGPALEDHRRWRDADRSISARQHRSVYPRDFAWLMPLRPGGGWRPVPSELNRRLNALLWRAGDAPPPAVAAPIGAGSIPSPFRRWSAGANCDVRSFSTPVVIEDVAFVERAQDCGHLCGGGSLLALQRIGGRWIPVAFINTWIS